MTDLLYSVITCENPLNAIPLKCRKVTGTSRSCCFFGCFIFFSTSILCFSCELSCERSCFDCHQESNFRTSVVRISIGFPWVLASGIKQDSKNSTLTRDNLIKTKGQGPNNHILCNSAIKLVDQLLSSPAHSVAASGMTLNLHVTLRKRLHHFCPCGSFGDLLRKRT